MKNRLARFLIIGLALFSVRTFGVDHPELKAFPPAKQGMERFIIMLAHKQRSEEDGFKVELIPGKVMPTDGVNLMRLGTTLEPHLLKGWGYIYYEVTGSDVVITTMMVDPEGEQKVDRFVQGTPFLIRYNSRLPIVIYVPKGHGIQYRIWNAGVARKAMKG